jgi:hypothetical protein
MEDDILVVSEDEGCGRAEAGELAWSSLDAKAHVV